MMTTEQPRLGERRTKLPMPRDVQNRLQSPARPLTEIVPAGRPSEALKDALHDGDIAEGLDLSVTPRAT